MSRDEWFLSVSQEQTTRLPASSKKRAREQESAAPRPERKSHSHNESSIAYRDAPSMQVFSRLEWLESVSLFGIMRHEIFAQKRNCLILGKTLAADNWVHRSDGLPHHAL
jgi:hypothetical protein